MPDDVTPPRPAPPLPSHPPPGPAARLREALAGRISQPRREEGHGLALADDRPAEEREDMPLPQDLRTVFLGGLFFLASLWALYVARDIILPLVMAIVLKLLLQPLVRLLERIRIPKAVGALAAIALLLGVFAGLGTILSGPVSKWAADLPVIWPRLLERFSFIGEAATHLQSVAASLGINLQPSAASSALLGFSPGAMITALFAGTGNAAAHILEMLLILFYLMVFGDIFLRRVVEILPRFREKREAVEISLQVERDISVYLLTVTVINAVVGVLVAVAMWGYGISGPPLWGVIAFSVNYVPILGPFFGILLFILVGLMVDGAQWAALMPAITYLCIHVMEGEIITPMLLARRFTINPVAVMLALVFWFWMWGVPGAILAVPMLAIAKILCDRIRPLRALGHFLEG